MENQYNVKKKNKKWVIAIVALSVILCTMLSVGAVKYYNHIKEEKGIEPIDEAWGLGKTVTESVSNNRDYEWYTEQMSGYEDPFSASCQMVLKWVNEGSQLKVSDIRKKVNEEVLGKKDYNSFDFFKSNNVNFQYIVEEKDYQTYFKDGFIIESMEDKFKEDLKENIKNGKICLVLCSMKNISFNLNEEQRCGRYISGSYYNFVILKGYKVVDKKLYFEVYDPRGTSKTYKDGTPIGKDRYYLADEVIKAVMNGYGCYIEK